jgi:hypothetical protein
VTGIRAQWWLRMRLDARLRPPRDDVPPATSHSFDAHSEEASVNSWYLWSAPVRNLSWVAARFGHR